MDTIYLICCRSELNLEKQKIALEHTANIPVSRLESNRDLMLGDSSGGSSLTDSFMKTLLKSPMMKEILGQPEMMGKNDLK